MSVVYRDDECPLCRSELFLNPNMRLQQAICGHKFCESCINRNFLSGNVIECPICRTVLRKANFMANKQEVDPEVEKELNIRKSILKDFNKRREDFPTLRMYNDYLEEVEDIIFNLVHGVDVEATQQKIRNYKKQNSEQIIVNQSKRASEEQELQARLLAEQAELEDRRQQRMMEQQRLIEKKNKEREEALDSLLAGRGLKYAAQQPKAQPEKPKTLATILQETAKPIPKPAAYVPAPPLPPPPPMPMPTYTTQQPQQQQQQPPQPPQNQLPQPMEISPPPATKLTEEEQEKLRQTQFKAGGWKEEYVRKRALEDAMAALFVF